MDVLNIVLYALPIVTVLWGFLRGRRKGGLRAFLRLSVTFVAAVVAFASVLEVYQVLGQPVDLSVAELSTVLDAYPESAELIEKIFEIQAALPQSFSLLMLLPLSLFGPLMFSCAFWVYRILFGLLYLAVALILFFVAPKKKGFAPISKTAGGLFGALRGALFAFVLLFPIIGYSAMSEEIFLAVDGLTITSENTTTVHYINEEAKLFTETGRNHPVSKVVATLGGKKAFTALTSFSCQLPGGETVEVFLEKEMDIYAQGLVHAKPLFKANFENLREEDVAAIRALAMDVRESKALSIVIAEALSRACQAWDRGEPFLGVAKPTVKDESVANILETAIDTFKTSTPATVSQDILSVANLLEVMAKYDVFSSLDHPDTLLEILQNDDFMEDAIAVLKENDRLEDLLKETVKTGVKAAVESAAGDETFNETVDALTASAAEELNALASLATKEEQTAAVADAITQALQDNDIHQGGAVVDYVAELLIDEFADQIQNGTVTPEDVAAYLGLAKVPQE